jgi:ParB-like chromosome segregation protein Spo0J
MTAAATSAPSALEVQQIPIKLIDPCPVNPRKNFDQAKLAEFAVYELVAGHRRTEAAKLARKAVRK